LAIFNVNVVANMSATDAHVHTWDLPEGVTFNPEQSSRDWAPIEWAPNRISLNIGAMSEMTVRNYVLALNVSPDLRDSFDIGATVFTTMLDVNTSNNAAYVTTNVTPPAPSSTTRLYVSTQSLGGPETVVRNEKNLVGMQFQFFAGENGGFAKDIVTTQFIVSASSSAQNYSLWVEIDGAMVRAQGGKHAINGKVTFDYTAIIPAYQTRSFQVRFDVASSVSNRDFHLDFDTSNPAAILAEELESGLNLAGISVNSNDPDADIFLSTATPKSFHVVDQGSLQIDPSFVPQRARDYLVGQLGAPGLVLDLRASDEQADIFKTQVLAVGYGAGAIERIEAYYGFETTPFMALTVSATGSDPTLNSVDGLPTITFTGRTQSTQFLAVEDMHEQIILRPRLKAQDEISDNLSGKTFYLMVSGNPVINTSTGEGAFHVRGLQSARNLVGNDGDINVYEGEVVINHLNGVNRDIKSPVHTVTYSLISQVTSANPDMNPDMNAAVPSGPSTVGMVTLTAAETPGSTKDGPNKAVVSTMSFVVNATNVLVESYTFGLYNHNNSSVVYEQLMVSTIDGTPIGDRFITGSFIVRFSNIQNSMVESALASGESASFALQFEIVNPKMNSALPSALDVLFANDKLEWLDVDAGMSVRHRLSAPADLFTLIGRYRS
jgi:hypothetical protein